jgi:acyl carrier protein
MSIPGDANRVELEPRLVHCFAAAFGNLGPEEIRRADVTSLAEWDSVASMTLVALIEEEFQLRIDVSDIPRLRSFSSILNYVTDNARSSTSGLSMAGGRDHAR